MKHRICIFIVVCLALLLAACDQDAPLPTDGTSVTTEPSQSAHIHSYTAKQPVEPSCTKDGYTPMVCSCGLSYQANILDAFGHAYHETVVPPTAEEAGYTLHTCGRCDHSYKDSETLPTGSKSVASMTFDEFMSQKRIYSRINAVHWVTPEGKESRLRVDREGLAVVTHPEGVRRVPNTQPLSQHTLIGCNGEFAIVTSEKEILQVSIETGRIQSITSGGETVLSAWLCNDYFLYYALYNKESDTARIFLRSFLPNDQRLLIIPDIPANGTPLSQFFFPAPETNSQTVDFYTMNPKMLEQIQQELVDPDSPYRFDQRIQVAALWEDPDRIYASAYANKVCALYHTLHNEHHIAPHICYTCVLGEGIQAQRDTTAPDPKPLPQKYRQLEVILYQTEYADLYPGYDFTDCTSGHYYAGNRITKELTWLHDGTISQLQEQRGPLFHWAASKGNYIYYTLKDEPTNIYRMDYQGVVRDELVYEGDPTLPMDFMVISNTHDYEQLAIHQGKNIYILDLLEDTCELVYEGDNIHSLWGYEYDASTQSFIVAYVGDGDGYRWYYNITTGEMDQHPDL